MRKLFIMLKKQFQITLKSTGLHLKLINILKIVDLQLRH